LSAQQQQSIGGVGVVEDVMTDMRRPPPRVNRELFDPRGGGGAVKK
jgi:hypothetical protein